MISEQISRLKEKAKILADSGCSVDGIAREFLNAADTIETLSAKLAAANMERSSMYYGGGWIPCNERLPEDLKPVNVTWANRSPEPYYTHIKDKPFTATAICYRGKWYWYSCVCEDYLAEYGHSECDVVAEGIEIIAWRHLPEPYKGD